jgi:type IV pilus assembly protein PilM
MSLFPKRSFVGIDLGSHCIKIVQLEGSGAGAHITRTYSCPTPFGGIKDGMVTNVEAVGAAIREAMREGRFSATNAIIAAAGGAIFVRPVAFPKMPEATLRRSIKIEASRYVPGTPDDCHIEFEILGSIDDDRMNVLIVAAPKDIVSSRIAACEIAGLSVEIVDIEAFAMYRALVESYRDPNVGSDTVALVDIGAASTNVSVVHRGAFVVNRSVPNGSQLLTDALKSYFRLETEDAEQGKSQLNAADLLDESGIKENPPLRVVQPHIDDLVREIRRSLNYFQSQQADSPEARQVQKIVLAGGGAKMPGLAQYMESKLGLPISCLGIYENPRFVPRESDADSGVDLAVATGLAMRAPNWRAA